jgi:hypothetical protein
MLSRGKVMVINTNTVSSYPWTIQGKNILSADGSKVAQIIYRDDSLCRDEDLSNTNIISASPELYIELKYALECLKYGLIPNEKWVERASIAINKVEVLK